MEAELLWGLGFLAVGLFLMIIEIFVVTFGVLTLLAAGSGITGVVLLFTHSTTWGLIGATLLVIGGPVIFFFGLRIMPNTAIGRRLVLRNPGEDDEESGPVGGQDPYRQLIGSEGVVVTDLRPVGTVRVGDERLDALAETTILPAGTRIKVIAVVDGRTLKVRAV